MTSVPELDPTVAAMQQELAQLRAEVDAWRARYTKGEKRETAYTNSAKEVAPLYTALDQLNKGFGCAAGQLPHLGFPGSQAGFTPGAGRPRVRRSPGATYASMPRIGFTPAFFAL